MSPFVVATFIFAATLCLTQGKEIYGRPNCTKANCVAVECKPTQKLHRSQYECCEKCLDTFEDGSVCFADIQCREGSRCRQEMPGRAPVCPNGRPCQRRCIKND